MLTWISMIEGIKKLAESLGIQTAVLLAVLVGINYGFAPMHEETTRGKVLDTAKNLQEHRLANEQLHKEMLEQYKTELHGLIFALREICFNTAVYDKERIRACGRIGIQ